MSSAKQSPPTLRMIVRLSCLTGVLTLSAPGCSIGGDPTPSPEAKAKAKENFKKRFADSGDKEPQQPALKSPISLYRRIAAAKGRKSPWTVRDNLAPCLEGSL